MKRVVIFLLAAMMLACAALPCAAEAPKDSDFSYYDTVIVSPTFARTSERSGVHIHCHIVAHSHHKVTVRIHCHII